ncbi:MAG: glycosyltransferase [bacterium]
MKNVLFISGTQFGYSSDYYYYTKYLSQEFKVSIITRNKGLPKINSGAVVNIEFMMPANKIARHLKFIWDIVKYLIQNNHYDIIFVNNFFLCYLLPMVMPRRNFVLDIRSGGVSQTKYKRILKNLRLIRNAFFFPKIIVLSDSLAKKLKLSSSKYKVIPLGADQISTTIKNFNVFKLLYIGTFQGRRIYETIEGFYKFINRINEEHEYYIIGFGSDADNRNINDAIRKYKLEARVKVLGRLSHQKAKEYFDKCNIGVSYVPVTDYYNVQPPTKTFEYLCSGLPVLATNTFENQKVINNENGVLIDDTPNSFHEGLLYLWKKKDKLNSEKIQITSLSYTWENITNKTLAPYIRNHT